MRSSDATPVVLGSVNREAVQEYKLEPFEVEPEQILIFEILNP